MEIEQEIRKIKQRNKKVEQNKEWETSWTRRIAIFVLTYLVIVVFFYSAELPDPWWNATVPALAFLLSTLTLPFLKRMWSKSS